MMRLSTLLFLAAGLAAASPSAAQAPTLVRDFWTGSNGQVLNNGHPNAFREFNGRLLLCAMDGLTTTKLFALDDLSGTVHELAQEGNVVGYTTTNGGIITSGENIYFYGPEPNTVNSILWCVHPNGTVEALATIPYQVLFYYIGIPMPGGGLIFIQSDADHGFEPWITDGTAAGTHLLKDIDPGTTTSIGNPFPLFQGFDFHGKAYFMASDGVNGYQLWTSDGTEAGTTQYAMINDPDDFGAIALRYSKNNDAFIVTTPDGLLSCDGTVANNTIIHSAQFAFAHIPGATYSVSDEGWMYFSAAEDQWKLYRTQGTQASTELIFSGAPPQGFVYLTELNGQYYTFSNDGTHILLIRLDPVSHTQSVVRTFEPNPNGGANAGAFYGFRNDGQHFYFMGEEGTSGTQYWVSDGTEQGTHMIYQFMPNSLNGGPNAADGNMIVFQNTFVFAANDAGVGFELWAGNGVAGIADVEGEHALVDARYDTDGQLQVDSRSGTIRAVRVYDATGRLVLDQQGGNTDRLRIGLHERAGIYQVHVTTAHGAAVVRVLVF